MSVNATMCSVIDRTGDSTATDPDTIIEKINNATIWINLLQAQLALFKAKIVKAKESKRTNSTTLGDCTEISQSFYDRVLELWTAVQNYKIRIQNETNKFFNVLASELMGQPSPDPEIEVFRMQILELGNVITPLYILQMEIAEDKKQLDLKMTEKQTEMITLISEVGDKLEQSESQTHPREIQRCNERLMKIKICRSVINSLLTRSNVNYEMNPDLVDIRIKWRKPISLKSKSN